MVDSANDQGALLLRVVIATLVIGGIFIFARTINRTLITPQFG